MIVSLVICSKLFLGKNLQRSLWARLPLVAHPLQIAWRQELLPGGNVFLELA